MLNMSDMPNNRLMERYFYGIPLEDTAKLGFNFSDLVFDCMLRWKPCNYRYEKPSHALS